MRRRDWSCCESDNQKDQKIIEIKAHVPDLPFITREIMSIAGLLMREEGMRGERWQIREAVQIGADPRGAKG